MKHQCQIYRCLIRVGIVAGLVLSVGQGASRAEHLSDRAEDILFESANRSRIAQGLPALKWSDALAHCAKEHAKLMARQNTLSHQFSGEAGLSARSSQCGARFSSIAENIAEGPDASGIHDQWMKSPPHRRNLLDPELDSIGIAVAEEHGILFAVEDFSLSVETLSLSEQEKLIVADPKLRGLRLRNYKEEARRTCAMDNGYAGKERPSFVLHYVTSDLKDLPKILQQRIKTNRYTAIAVGACSPGDSSNFTQYRIAIMLFE